MRLTFVNASNRAVPTNDGEDMVTLGMPIAVGEFDAETWTDREQVNRVALLLAAMFAAGPVLLDDLVHVYKFLDHTLWYYDASDTDRKPYHADEDVKDVLVTLHADESVSA